MPINNKIYLKTYGCSLNTADSERIKGILKKNGFSFTNNYKKAELIILNTCTVKTPTINKIKRFVQELEDLKKPILISGCISQAQPDIFENHSMIGPSQIEHIIEAVEETLNGNIVKIIVPEIDSKLKMPILQMNDIIEIVPICQGCLGDPCSYCLVKKARGNLRSYKIEDIYKVVKRSIMNRHTQEIWLTAQDTGCYGLDINTNLIELLNKVLTIKGDHMIRLGMANPNHIKEITPELIKVFKSENMFKFLHIPIQSGNNEILKLMKRKYTIEDFKNIVKEFRNEIPEISISTDVICGFPTETDKQFQDTIDLIKETKPDVLNISKFCNLPGTHANTLEQVPGDKIKERSRKITEIFSWLQHDENKKWVGKRCKVIVDEIGKNDSFVARNESYKPVILKNEQNRTNNKKIESKTEYSSDYYIGEILDVKIVKHHGHDLYGQKI